MSEPLTNDPNMEEESFADLFENFSSDATQDVRVGDKVGGRIINIGSRTVFIELGPGREGIVDKEELLNEEGEFPFAEGDELELYVVRRTESEIRLSKAVSGRGGLEVLENAYRDRLPVEGVVRETCKGGFRVEVLKQRAFCPVSQIDSRYVENPEEYVGSTFSFLITKFEEGGRNIVISRRDLLMQEQAVAIEAFRERTRPGDELEGTVSRLMGYGAFVELVPGIEGMVHISELSWSRVGHAEEVVSVGETVRVKVLKIEDMDKPGQVRISLSMKQCQGDPWDTIDETFKEGDKVSGRVTRCMDFGAFVEIAPGVEGLVHISEMSYVKRVHRSDELVQPGDVVSVMIKTIDAQQRRIGLSLRDAAGDPWLDVAEKYQPGQKVTGTLEKKEQFGFFVQLEPGITGLLPKSRISRSERSSELDRLNPGDQFEVSVEEVRAGERKISLGTGEGRESEDWKQFQKPAAPTGAGNKVGFGSLGAKLQQAMQEKNKKN